MEDLVEINSIYLFCLDVTEDMIQLSEGTKIRGYSINLKLVPTTDDESAEASVDPMGQQQKHQRINRLSAEDFIFNSLPSFDINESSSSSLFHEETKRQEAEFMYAEILREILIQIDSTEDEMLDYCRQKYADNKAQLVFIEEFKEYYDPCNAIFWYTRDTFLYRLLNTAFREQDIDTLYALRYFIKHLHEQLMELHSLSKTDTKNATTSNIETVYRGQLMNSNEFDRKIHYNINGFLSVNTFLSTTANKELAAFFVSDNITSSSIIDEKDETKRILFQIDIDQTVNKFPYANISTKSAFGDDEGEMLFTMGAVFRITSIKLERYEDALLMYEKSLEIRLSVLPNAHSMIATVYNNIAQVYYLQGISGKAAEFWKKALAIQQTSLPSDHPILGRTYQSIAIALYEHGHLEQALEYAKQSQKIKSTNLPTDHRKVKEKNE
ncbi:unnamed protein product [Rotaria sordida]|uniref:NAD(P)(+)--arginine ADP-ribosyltransferase n=1 Tax=Rotaria sordida TaxID=392033 RepID=A0A815FEY8_9BILA|nr:unnamed protein product [Rotaria sordida]